MENNRTETFRHGVSYHTSKCVDVLKQGSVGDTLNRDEMSKYIDRPCEVHQPGYGNVQSAINIVERENGIVWRWSKELTAWKCLSPAECVKETNRGIGSARRRCNRSLRVAAAVDVKSLSPDERLQHNVNVAVAGTMSLFSSQRAKKNLAESPNLRQLEMGDIKSLFETS